MNMKLKRLIIFILPILVMIFATGAVFMTGEASTIVELERRINERNANIRELQAEIARYEKSISDTRAQARNLEGAIRDLSNSENRIKAEIGILENKIAAANLTIQLTEIQIREKEELIKQNTEAVGQILRNIHEKNNVSLVETVLAYDNLSEFWNEVETLESFHIGIKANLSELRETRRELDEKKLVAEENRNSLVSLTSDLDGQRQAIAYNRSEQNALLTNTKNTEANYQSILNQKIAQRKAFEQELLDFEAQLRIAIDPTSIPASRPGVLAWPMASVRITQYFGNTPFATANAQVYGGGGHNGIDLGAPIGTPIMSAETGVVVDTGDTDLTCPNASWGKWILVRHNNGLSTLYAHLSVISVAPGQAVKRGQTIGLNGNTGFSTGPHLHFTVYATQGVQVSSFPSRGCPGRTYTMPVADRQAYLNPLSFL
jgi:murein DD-endopeptidase MepM/ murein hydrolase activator NlpD